MSPTPWCSCIFTAGLVLGFSLPFGDVWAGETVVFEADAPIESIVEELVEGDRGSGIYRCIGDRPEHYQCEKVADLNESVVAECWDGKKIEELGCWLCIDVGLAPTQAMRCWSRRTDGPH